jgi:hypothetical protein
MDLSNHLKEIEDNRRRQPKKPIETIADFDRETGTALDSNI